MNAPPPILSVALIIVTGGIGYWQGFHSSVAGKHAGNSVRAAVESHSTAAAVDADKFLWLTKLESASASDMQALFAELGLVNLVNGLRIQQKPAQRREAVRLILLRWAELDPASAIAYFTDPENQKAEKQTNAIGTVIATWAEKDMVAAVAAAQAIPVIPNRPGEYRSKPLDAAGRLLLSGDPTVFWEWFKLTRSPLPSPWMTSSKRWQVLARSHHEELLALATELAAMPPAADAPKTSMAPEWVGIYSLLARTKAEADPVAALAWAKELPKEARNGALKAAIEALMKTDPQAAWGQLNEMKPVQIGPNSTMGSGAAEVAKKIIQQLGDRDPKAMLDWMKDQDLLKGSLGPNDIRVDSSQLASILSNAVCSGKMTTAEVFASLRGSKDEGSFIKLNVLPRLYQGLPVETLRQAGKELMASDSKSSKPYALAGVVAAWMNQDPAGAQAFMATITDAKDRATVAEHLGRDVKTRLTSLSADEIKSKLPVDVRAAALADGLRFNTETSNFSALAGSLDDVPAGKDKTAAMSRIAETWASTDPRESTLWAMTLPDVASQRAALTASGDAWAKQDEFGFSQWLQTQPQGMQRDIGAHRLAQSLVTTEPDSAWKWAGSIGDTTERTAALTGVLGTWGKTAPAQARAAAEAAWKQDSSLQATLTEALNNVNSRNGRN